MSKTLITGATGGLGSAVVKFLSQNSTSDLAVMVRDTSTEKAQAFAKQGIEVRKGDYDDEVSLIGAFEGIDTLYFVSGSDIGARLQQHQNVVEASSEAGVNHIVYTSAGRKNEGEDSPLYPVMQALISTENWIKASGMNYTILQHNLYAGVVPMFVGEKAQLLNSKTVYLPTGEGKTAFALRDELAEAGANVLSSIDQHVNKTYVLNGQAAVSFAEIASMLSDILDEKIGYHSPSVPEFQETMKSIGLPEEIIGMTVGFSLGIAAGEFDDEGKDLQTLLGREPMKLASFLQQVYG